MHNSNYTHSSPCTTNCNFILQNYQLSRAICLLKLSSVCHCNLALRNTTHKSQRIKSFEKAEQSPERFHPAKLQPVQASVKEFYENYELVNLSHDRFTITRFSVAFPCFGLL